MNFITKIFETYKNGKKYPELKENYDSLKSEHDSCEVEKAELRSKKEKLKRALGDARDTIKSMKDAKKHPDPLSMKDFFMYPDEQNDWEYPIRGGARIPVTKAFLVDDESLIVDFARKLVQKGSLRSKNNPTQIATFVYSYFEEEFEFDYTVDREQFGKIEYWEQADKTLETREGDCDDLALVMHLVLREVLRQTGFGDHVWRIRFTASRTLSGGHAYNIWLGEDLEWYVMESTMDQEGSFHRTWLETPLRHNNFYHSFYGFATPEQTWRGDLDSVQPADDDIKRP